MAVHIISLKEDPKGGEIKMEFKIDDKKDGFLAERLFRSLANSWGIELGIGMPEELAFEYIVGGTKNILNLDLIEGDLSHIVSKK